jgi:ferredoxin-NADP reductase
LFTHLLEFTVTAITVPAPKRSLLRRALASDLVDRLTAPHGVDRYLELVDPRWLVRETRAEVIAVERQTTGTVTLTLRPNDTWAGFRAGQHVAVGVDIDGVVHERCFSLAGSPHRTDATLELTVKANPTGRVSRHLVDHARRGDVLRLSEARGEFVLPAPEHRGDHLVFVSGGSGITPVLSMLRTLVHEGHVGAVTFVHYGLTAAEVCYRQELADLVAALGDARLLLGLTDAPGTGDLDGFFGAEHLAAITDDPSNCQIFLCGPAPLMASVEDHFAMLGLADRVHLERFGAPPLDPGIDTSAGVLRFERSGVTVAAEGTILATAEAAGLAPKFGCRRGICGTCTTTKSRGVVHDLVTGRDSTDEPGSFKPCTTVARGEVVVAL